MNKKIKNQELKGKTTKDAEQKSLEQHEQTIDDVLHELQEATEVAQNLRDQHDVMQDKLLRSMAENENVRARSSKMVEEAREYSITSFAKDLVPVIDNLSRAIEHTPTEVSDDIKAVFDGVQMTKQELLNVFAKHGLELIEPKSGEKFDYNIHNAISQIVTDEFEVGTIVSTMQIGYKIKDRLLRPAAVAVAKQ